MESFSSKNTWFSSSGWEGFTCGLTLKERVNITAGRRQILWFETKSDFPKWENLDLSLTVGGIFLHAQSKQSLVYGSLFVGKLLSSFFSGVSLRHHLNIS